MLYRVLKDRYIPEDGKEGSKRGDREALQGIFYLQKEVQRELLCTDDLEVKSDIFEHIIDYILIILFLRVRA